MTRRSALVALLIVLAAPAAARADTLAITMPGKYFDPARAAIVAGDSVVFRNLDLASHDVRIADGLFDSGVMPRFTSWTQTIEQPGPYPFLCTLHPFMRGHLDVLAATLETGSRPVLANEPVELAGRTRAGTPLLVLERSTPDGGWLALGTVAAAADGTFRMSVPAVEGAAYRVTTPAGSSPAVAPTVTAGVEVHLDVYGRHDRRTVRVHAMPAPAGLTATLERYSRWRYAWRAVGSARIDRHGGARFRVRADRHARVRVSLSRRAGGPVLARSRVARLRDGRSVRDPDAIVPPPSGHGPH